MLLPIKPICVRRPRRDGTSAISIQYCYSSDRRTLLFTGLAVPPRYWDTRSTKISSGLPPAFGDAGTMNMQLQKMIRIAEDTVSYALQQKMEDPVAFLRQVFHPEFDPATLSEKAKQMALEESNKVAV